MLKTALFGCAVSEKCCSVVVPTLGDLTAQESPPREVAIQGKKNANSRGSARGGGGWAQLELTDALTPQNSAV